MLASNEDPSTTIRTKLDEFWLHVTSRCNLSCLHCLFSCSPENSYPGTISLEEAKSYTAQAVSARVKTLYITGGEPFLWPELDEFLRWYYGRDKILPLTVLSNGTLIDRCWARQLQPYSVKGLNLRISMECYTRETHEQYRGSGSFAQVIAGIKNLNSEGIKPWVAYVNKSGGSLLPENEAALAEDFRRNLQQGHGIEIAGLKIIGAYKKGRFSALEQSQPEPRQVRSRLDKVQCTYGIAASKLGIVPCPILTDIPEAVIKGSINEMVGQRVPVNYSFCAGCFITGSCCGQ